MRIIPLLILVALFSCDGVKEYGPSDNDGFIRISGETMGTTYSVVYKGDEDYKHSIDSLLVRLNQEVSTYIDTSYISKFNQSDSGYTVCLTEAPHFVWNCIGSLEAEILTKGFFNPQVMPLVNYWGFGYEEGTKDIDSTMVDSLVHLAHVNALFLTHDKQNEKPRIVKSWPNASLDFSAIAKGYGVDLIRDLLISRGVEDMLVEIGGELYAKGSSPKGKPWLLGITKPKGEKSETSVPYLRVTPAEMGMATSGNYENYKVVDGKKVVHTIDPFTGYPKSSSLLSATVLNPSCMMADGIATGLMAMGFEKAVDFLQANGQLAIILIYADEEGNLQWMSSEYGEDFLVL